MEKRKQNRFVQFHSLQFKLYRFFFKLNFNLDRINPFFRLLSIDWYWKILVLVLISHFRLYALYCPLEGREIIWRQFNILKSRGRTLCKNEGYSVKALQQTRDLALLIS